MLSMVTDALDRSQKCSAYRKQIVESNKHPATSAYSGAIYLRALLPIIHVHSETAEEALAHATCETFGIGRILHHLEGCAEDLDKFAEQNHNMADQLDGYVAGGNTLANEKRAIAEIEEVVVRRIRNLHELSMGASAEEETNNGDANEESQRSITIFDNGDHAFTPMSDLCGMLLSKHKLESDGAAISLPVTRGQFSESQMDAANTLLGL